MSIRKAQFSVEVGFGNDHDIPESTFDPARRFLRSVLCKTYHSSRGADCRYCSIRRHPKSVVLDTVQIGNVLESFMCHRRSSCSDGADLSTLVARAELPLRPAPQG
jgi:hypothetical protein